MRALSVIMLLYFFLASFAPALVCLPLAGCGAEVCATEEEASCASECAMSCGEETACAAEDDCEEEGCASDEECPPGACRVCPCCCYCFAVPIGENDFAISSYARSEDWMIPVDERAASVYSADCWQPPEMA